MSKKRGILFVDDEPYIHDGIRRILRHQREVWNMCFATSVDEALEILSKNNIETVVSDITMPGKDGFELLRAIRKREQTKDIPVVMLTGLNQNGIKRLALELGATDLLNKPADPDELVARIENMLLLKSYQDEIKAQNESLEQKVKERTSELEAARIDLIWRLGKAAEHRDTDTGNHIVRVGYYSQVLADGLGLDGKFSETIFLTAPLHDIGKIGIPDSILLKPGKLDEEEWRVMKGHCKIGADILRKKISYLNESLTPVSLKRFNDCLKRDNPFLKMASIISVAHHERWDGSGYPSGLAGKEIPIEARIVAVADTYDALFSERPYKHKFPEEKALSIMRSSKGSHFDPEVFAAFEKIMDAFSDIRTRFADDEELKWSE